MRSPHDKHGFLNENAWEPIQDDRLNVTRTFLYTNNTRKLWGSLLSAVFTVLLVWVLMQGEVESEELTLLERVVLTLLVPLGSWFTFDSFRTFLKLRGHERQIVIGERSISLPESGDSLNLIKLDFTRIHGACFNTKKNGDPYELVILYDQDGEARIDRGTLKKPDFETICELFQSRLKLDKIETR